MSASIASDEFIYTNLTVTTSNHIKPTPNQKKLAIKNSNFKLAIAMLGACNSVSPTEVDGKRQLQASSPDEIAFVDFTDSIGYFMDARSTDQIVFKQKYLGDNF